MQRAGFLLSAVALKVLVLLGMLACFEAGANEGANTAGHNDHGYNFNDTDGHADLIITPQGDRLMAVVDDQLYFVNLQRPQDTHSVLLTGVTAPSLANFSRDGRYAYVWSETEQRLHQISLLSRLDDKRALAEPPGCPLTGPYDLMDMTWDDRTLVLTDTEAGVLHLVRTADCDSPARIELEDRILDIDFTPDGGQIIAVGEGGGFNAARVYFIDLYDFSVESLEIPNCADELVLTHSGERAFLAPTRCRAPSTNDGGGGSVDPISVIDVPNRRFEQNLPGFGPVLLTPDGREIIGFAQVTAQQVADEVFPVDVAGTYLLFVNVYSLEIRWHWIGDELPSYYVTPDGEVVLIYTFFGEATLEVMDLETKEVVPVESDSEDLYLWDFVVTQNGELVYSVFPFGGPVTRIDVPALQATELDLGFDVDGINILPDDSWVVLSTEGQTRFWLLEPGTDQLGASFTVP